MNRRQRRASQRETPTLRGDTPVSFEHLEERLLLSSVPAATLSLDLDSTIGGGITTEAGFTSLDATDPANGDSVILSSAGLNVTATVFSAAGSQQLSDPNDLTGDFIYDDGDGEAVGVTFDGLEAGRWIVEVWSWDNSTPGLGDEIIGYIEGTVGVDPETIVTTSATPDTTDPVSTFVIDADGASEYSVFVRENNADDRAVLNAVRLTQVSTDEDTAFGSFDDYDTIVQNDDPLLYWQLDDADTSNGATAVNSAAGGSSLGAAGDGTYLNVVTTVADGAVPNSTAVNMGTTNPNDNSNGDGVFVDFAGNFPTTAITVEGWFRGDPADNDDPTFFSYEPAGDGNELIVIEQDGDDVRIFIDGEPRDTGLGQSDIIDGEWHHLAMTWDSASGVGQFYLDGVLEHTATNFKTGDTLNTTGRFMIGQEQDGPGAGFDNDQKFEGDVDNVAIYGTVLDDDAIAARYAAAAAASLVDTPGDLITSVNGDAELRGTQIALPGGGTVQVARDGSVAFDPGADFQSLDTNEYSSVQFDYTLVDFSTPGLLVQTWDGVGGVSSHANADNARDNGAFLGEAVYTMADTHNSAGSGNFGVNNPVPGLGGASNSFAVFGTGVIVVDTAGTFSFMTTSDDGNRLRIDLDGDGLESNGDDDVIVDDSNHGVENRFSDTLFPAGVFLAEGVYEFEWMWFENGGGATGELAYAAGDTTTVGDFVLLGDNANGLETFAPTQLTADLVVLGVDDPADAVDDAAATRENDAPITIDVLANDTDIDTNDPLSVVGFTQGANGGIVTMDGNNLVYAAGGSLLGLDFGDTATDTFTYTISDDEGVMDTATVTVTVTGEPTLETDEDTAINGYDAAVNADDPLIYWRLGDADKSNGATAVNSATGPSSLGAAGDGTYAQVVGDVLDTEVTGDSGASFGTSVSTSTTGDRVFLDSADFPTGDTTIELWVRSTQNSQAGIVSYASSDSDDNEHLLFADGTDIEVWFNGSSQNSGITQAELFNGEWNHVVITRDGATGTGAAYLNGVFQGNFAATTTPLDAPGSLVLAQEQDDEGDGFNDSQKLIGDLDEFALYDRVLTPEQIAAHYRTADTNVLGSSPGTLTAVEGQLSNIGNPVALPSGAVVTINADGTTSYDPNGAFEHLTDNETATDTFQFSVVDPAMLTPGVQVDVYRNGTIDSLADSDAARSSGTLSGSAIYATADTHDSSGDGNFADNHPIPGGGGDDYATFGTGTLHVPSDGVFSFMITGDDGGRLRIDLDRDGLETNGDDDIIIDDALHPVTNVFSDNLYPSGVFLEAGFYEFEWLWFERSGGATGELAYAQGDTTSIGNFVLVGNNANGITAYAETDPTETVTASVTINGINDDPIANVDMYEVDENSVLADNVLDNDVDAEMDIEVVGAEKTNPQNTGTPVVFTTMLGVEVTVNPDGTFTYDPTGSALLQDLNAGDSMIDMFTYLIEDGEGVTDTAIVSITVNGVSEAEDESFVTNQDNVLVAPAAGVLSNDGLVGTQIGMFTGSDPGEGLDLSGDFVYAVNARGPAVGLIGDANFTDDSVAGVNLTAQNEILNWSAPNFDGGDGGSGGGVEGALETVMQSIRWSNDPADVEVELDMAITPGNTYRLQLLFSEQCCDRGFDVFADGQLIADDFSPNAIVAASGTPTAAVVISHTFVATSGMLDITLDGSTAPFPDKNPILNGFTLENLGVDEAGFVASAVNGDTGAIGNETTLPSGALVTLDADGGFTYDPNDAFDALSPGELTTDTFTYTISDGVNSDTATVSVVVTGLNDAPLLTQVSDEVTVLETQTAVNSGTFADVDTTMDTVTLNASIGTLTYTPSNGGDWSWEFVTSDGPVESQTVTITADDGVGGISTIEFELVVENVDPFVTRTLSMVTVNEDNPAINSGTFSDMSPVDIVDITASVGIVTHTEGASSGTWDWILAPTDGPMDSQTVTITATDDDGGVRETTFELIVRNVDPVINTLMIQTPALEGEMVGLQAMATDPADPLTYTWQIERPNGTTFMILGDDTFFVPDDNGNHKVTLIVNDGDGGIVQTNPRTIAVGNIAPTITDLSLAPIPQNEGSAVELTGTFTDPGTLDTFTVTIDWGDGTSDEVPVGMGVGAFDIEHVYADGDVGGREYMIDVTVTDDDGGMVMDALMAEVDAVAPEFVGPLVISDAVIDEGDTIMISGEITDPGVGPHTIDIDWGDGEMSQVVIPAELTTFALLHTYNNGDVGGRINDITATVTDVDDLAGVVMGQVTVNAVAPEFTVGPGASPTTVEQTETTTISGSFDDPGVAEHTVTIDWGDGTMPDTIVLPAGVTDFSMDHAFDPHGVFNVEVTVTDPSGLFATDSVPITVTNVAPFDLMLDIDDSDENEEVTLDIAFDDLGAPEAHTVVVDWGDGSAPETINLGDGDHTANPTHTYLDDDPTGTPSDVYDITVTITDESGAELMGGIRTAVDNVAPDNLVVDVTPETFNEGDTITLEGAFDDPGTLDSHMLVIDWGDGSSQTVELNVGDRTFEIQHTLLDDVPSLTASDVHQISVTLTDDDGGTTAAATNITVNNVAPEAAIEGPDAGVRGQPLNFMGNANDAGASDTHIFGWRVFNDDTGELVAIGRGPSYEFIPATSGSYTVELTITDDDLAMDVTTHDLEVTDFGVQIDPVTGETLLVMGGSVTADTVRVTVDGNGDIVVNLRNSEDGQIVETFDVGAIDRLVIYTQGGDDNINAVVTSIDLPVEIHAGDGNDVVTVDILNGGTVFGQLGDDTLTGRRGFNTLDGGPGNDRLNGGVDDDFLIGGLGDDRLVGNNGNDALRGDTGNDHLIGGAGNDFLNGGDGDDILEGNGGIDLLAGGLGQDILKGVRFEDEIEPGPDVDILQ